VIVFIRILGPPALVAASKSGEGLPIHVRPVFNYAMRGIVTAFTGIRKKDELVRLYFFLFYTWQ
jgi:hypothetical protein